MFFCDFRYFLAEIEGPEQNSDSEAEKGLQMLLDSDLPALEMDFSGATKTQLVHSQLRWKVDILGFPATYNSPYFARDLMAQIGVQISSRIPSLKRRNWHQSGS